MSKSIERSPKPTFTFTMEAVPDDIPPIIRLRRFLKAAQRAYGLKCIDVKETTPTPPEPA